MNSNQIYEGEEYAWFPNRPKGRAPIGAAKVKALSISRHKSSWAKNASTTVEVIVLEEGTGWNLGYYKEGRKMNVPAREIIDFWDSYKDEESMLLEERRQRELEAEKRAEERRLEREKAAAERERAEREKEVRQLVLQNLIGSKLVEKGLPYGSVSMFGATAVQIPIATLLNWLGITQDEIDGAVNTVLSSDPETADASSDTYIIGGGP